MRVAIIPARGGSRRVPRKNIRDFHGKPMLLYPIEAAEACGLFDLIVVSTDDAEIANVAFKAGVAVLPRAPDDGSTGTQEIAARVLEKLRIQDGEACVIYPCSPLLLPADLHRGWSLMHRGTSASNFAMSVGPDGKDAGCFYWGSVAAFLGRESLERPHANWVRMPAERCIDINTESDWQEAERKFTALRRAS